MFKYMFPIYSVLLNGRFITVLPKVVLTACIVLPTLLAPLYIILYYFATAYFDIISTSIIFSNFVQICLHVSCF